MYIELTTAMLPHATSHFNTLVSPAMDSGGVMSWINAKNTEAQVTIRAVAATLCIISVLVTGHRTSWNTAKIIMAGLTGAVVLYIVFNMTTLQSKVSNEINNTSGSGQFGAATQATPSPTAKF